jgi:BirA family biotin operon repressor/biotin-[acetyl-CoA-carboxylase] ligase
VVLILDDFQRSGFAAMRREWLALHVLQGKPVRVLNGDGSAFDAVVRDVGEDGSLRVSRNGREVALSFGELSLRRATGVKQ